MDAVGNRISRILLEAALVGVRKKGTTSCDGGERVAYPTSNNETPTTNTDSV